MQVSSSLSRFVPRISRDQKTPESEPPSRMKIMEIREILEAYDGKLVLTKPPHLKGSVCFARGYHAMDKGRQFLGMGFRSTALAHEDLDEETWQHTLEKQRGSSAVNAEVDDVGVYFQVETASRAAALRVRLEQAIVVLEPSDQEAKLWWSHLQLLMCEVKQVLNNKQIGIQCLTALLDSPRELWIKAARDKIQALQTIGAEQKCHMVIVTSAALTALAKARLANPNVFTAPQPPAAIVAEVTGREEEEAQFPEGDEQDETCEEEVEGERSAEQFRLECGPRGRAAQNALAKGEAKVSRHAKVRRIAAPERLDKSQGNVSEVVRPEAKEEPLDEGQGEQSQGSESEVVRLEAKEEPLDEGDEEDEGRGERSARQFRPKAAPRGRSGPLMERTRTAKALYDQQPGSFRSCSLCGFGRRVADGSRQLHCLFPGRGPWRCGAQPCSVGWRRQPEVPMEEVSSRNQIVIEAFRVVHRHRQPQSERARHVAFLGALRAQVNQRAAAHRLD